MSIACSFTSIPTAASQVAFKSLWGRVVVRYGVYMCTWGSGHTGILLNGARQLGCALGHLYSQGARSQGRSQETVETNSPWLQGLEVWTLANQQFPPHFFGALIKILMRVARTERKQTVWKANVIWEECIKAKSCTHNQSLRQLDRLHGVWAE